MVQGGYNVALIPGDSVERHFMDTIDGGKWLPNQELAWTLVTNAIERVRELENEIGCFFDRNPDGSLHGKAFAGQTFDRTVHKGDLTGIEIINRLMEQVWARPDPPSRGASRGGADPDQGSAAGARPGVLMIDVRTGTFRFVEAQGRAARHRRRADHVQVPHALRRQEHGRPRHGAALGLPLRDMEMVQFHPTGVLAGPDTRMTGTIIEEGLRGAGGYLLDGDEQRFMFNYDPRGERATRDLVSQSMYREMQAGRTTPNGGLYIAMGHLGREKVREAVQGHGRALRRLRLRSRRRPRRGGADRALPDGRRRRAPSTPRPSCRACSSRARTRAACTAPTASAATASPTRPCSAASPARSCPAGSRKIRGHRAPDEAMIEAEMARALHPFTQGARRHQQHPRGTARPDVGRRRHHPRRDRPASAALRVSKESKRSCSPPASPTATARFNLTWHDWLNLRSQIEMSKVIALAAMQRENSRGAHYREDFKEPGDLATSTYTVVREKAGKLDVTSAPVQFTIVKPGETLLKEAEAAE